MVKSLTNPFEGYPTPLGTLFQAAARKLFAQLDEALVAAGFDDVRAAHTPLFLVISPAGSSVSELAQRTRMTKQAAGELIRYLESRGYLTVEVPDTDRRARLVRLTERGWQALEAGKQVVTDYDDWLRDSIGAAELDSLRAVLERILDGEPPDRHRSGPQ